MKRSKNSTGAAKKRFGQHFLEPAWVAKLVTAIDPHPEDVFLEIGPGRGALTRPLTDRSAAVVAVEIDRDLASALRAAAPRNLSVLEGDFLELPDRRVAAALEEARVSGGPLRVAANLPYNVASPILIKLVDVYRSGLPIVDAVVMLQREVADRVLAEAATAEYGLLTVIMRRWTTADRLMNLPPGAFRPAPKVRSSVVRLRFHQAEDAAGDELRFRRFVQALFTRRRKTLRNALQAWSSTADAAAMLIDARLDGDRRAETLSLDEFARLARLI